MPPTRKSPPDTHRKTRRTAAKSGNYDYDVVIIGGGMGGGTLAALLGESGFRVACIDRDDPARLGDANADGRTIAISWGSKQVLDMAGCWTSAGAGVADSACPIRTIDILDGGSPLLLQFDSTEVGGESFGWIVENYRLRRNLIARMTALSSVDSFAPATVAAITRDDDRVQVHLQDGRVIGAALLVGADGRQSAVRDWAGIGTRGWSYRQRALVCTVEHEHPHNHVAVEHFRAQGPFAILPMNDTADGVHRSSVVWTEHGAERHSMLHAPVDVFNAGLAARFPDSYGWVRLAGKRFAYPLTLQHAYVYTAPRVALVADAAHGIHPIAGQGLNLGFRDIAALHDVLNAARERGDDLGGDGVLRAYEQRRRMDNMAMAGTTDALVWLFSNMRAPLPVLRKAGLRMVARVPVAKRFFMHQAMGRRSS